MDEENNIQEFRYIIQKIKINIIQKKTLETQNTTALEVTVKPELVKLFFLLREIIENNKPLSVIPDTNLQRLFYRTLQEVPRTAIYENELKYYIYRDLIDYPLIIDRHVIDEYKSRKNLGIPHVLENNNSLTVG